ncbi:MAG: FMN-binding protein [Alphaproteobacteria bacterium]|nr:FMN-binding protein [Alphaproteobacteria bacterium]
MFDRRRLLFLLGAALFPFAARAERYVEPEEAARLIFPDANEIVPFSVDLNKAQTQEIKRRSGTRVRNSRISGFEARRDGQAAGFVYVDAVIGKHEYITYAAGISGADKVVGVEIIEYRETWGFEIRDLAWRAQFRGKSPDDPVKLGKDIENISGATLSCRNVTDGVRRLLATHVVLGR